MNKLLLLLTAILFIYTVPQTKADDFKYHAIMLSDSADNLTAFSAKIKDKEIHLIWKISNPKLVSYFIIERTEHPDKGYKALNQDNKVRKSEFIEKLNDNNVLSYKYSYTDEPEKDGVFY